MKSRFYLLNALLFLLLLGAGCTGTGRLQEGERLYTGAKIKLTKTDLKGSTKLLKADLKKSLILPRPNKKILWMRPRLLIYYMFQNSREKSFGNFVSNRMGEAPVLYEPKIIPRQRELLVERAANDGYFKVTIVSEEKMGKHKAKIIHRVLVRTARERIDNVEYPPDSTILMRRIKVLQPESGVKSGQFYHLEELIAERQRISDTLRNHGWYYFSENNLLFEADTLHPAGDVNLSLRVKKETTARERQAYRIASVTVYPDYNLAKQTGKAQQPTDTLRFKDLTYIYHRLWTKTSVLNRQISIKPNQYYANSTYQATIYRLLNLNIYKFINIRFDVSPLADTLLDARIYLTPYRPERLDGTFSGVFSPSFYYGLRTGIAYTHRNIFHGAEALRISVNGAYLRTDKTNFDFQDFIVSDASVRLTMPRFLGFKERNKSAFRSTHFTVRHETNWFKYDLPELGPFRLSFQRIEGEAGYIWRKRRNASVVYTFNPVNLGLQFSTINQTKVRQQLIAKIPSDTTGTSIALLTFLEYKPNVNITIDQRLEPGRRLSRYFHQRFAAQASGYTLNRYLPTEYKLASPLNFFVESDYRQYQKTNARNVLALRLAVGAGIPLRPNGTIALLDRYVIGGAASVRAFAPRTVGPGSEPRDNASGGLSVGKYTGNLLIESSIEYRMPLGRYPELAFFVDAGNIWLTSGPDATEASHFRLNRFYRELAFGPGVGFRVNLGFFVLRLDVAFPLTKPYLPLGERWVGNDLHFGIKSWRKENLNWNFSFGYPF